MATNKYLKTDEMDVGNPRGTKSRSIIEASFHKNNVVKVTTLQEAYELAKTSPKTIVTDIPVYHSEEYGLAKDANVLLFNDGSVAGPYHAARRVAGEPDIDTINLDKIVMDAIYETRSLTLYHAEVVIGLDTEFMLKAHLLIPEGEEALLYFWMLNFQYLSKEYIEMYKDATQAGNKTDIYIYSYPQWKHSDYPLGLTYYNTTHNCAALLGIRYFGEHRKGTLTTAWAIAQRNGYVPCHGGLIKYRLPNGSSFIASVFGLSDSDKTAIMHAKHNNKYKITVLHEDTFIINEKTASSIALEPTYYEKTVEHPIYDNENTYLLAAQNCSATINEEGKLVLVTQNIQNGNGHALKARLLPSKRVDRFEEPVNAIFWIINNSTLPPVLKLKDPSFAAVMGATLTTKRSSSDRLASVKEPNALVVEPYANPFRTYPLANDYRKWKKLMEERHVDCYLLNTGNLLGKNIPIQDTLHIIESIVEGKADFVPWGSFEDILVLEKEGFVPDLTNSTYSATLKTRINERIAFVKSQETFKDGYDRLPKDALAVLEKIVSKLP